MSGVKRYEHAGDYCGPRCGFEESADGDWVFASDYDALSQRCRELQHAATNDLLTRLLEQLDASNAENYHGAEFDVEIGSEQMTAIVMLQRRGRPSAHDLRLRAEQERDQLRAEREALTQRCAELEQCMSEPLNKLVRERDRLRDEVDALRKQAARYERLRRLDPRQFAELHQRCLAGERFDDLVDAL